MYSLAVTPRTGATRRPDVRVLLAFAAIYVLWGGTFLAIRVAVHSLPPFLTAGVRYLLAGLVMMAWARWRGEKIPAARAWMYSAIVALLPVASLAVGMEEHRRIDAAAQALQLPVPDVGIGSR